MRILLESTFNKINFMFTHLYREKSKIQFVAPFFDIRGSNSNILSSILITLFKNGLGKMSLKII